MNMKCVPDNSGNVFYLSDNPPCYGSNHRCISPIIEDDVWDSTTTSAEMDSIYYPHFEDDDDPADY